MHRAHRYPHLLRDRAERSAAASKPHYALPKPPIDDRGPSQSLSAPPCSREPRPRPVANQITLELRYGPQDIEEQPPRWRGGVETLVTLPATTSHLGMSPADREALGITDSLVRVSVGIESIDDLLADFDQALNA